MNSTKSDFLEKRKINELIQQTKSENPIIAETAINELKKISGKKVDEALISAISHPDLSVDIAAILALEKRYSPEADRALIRAIKKLDTKAFGPIIYVIKYRRGKEFENALLSLTEHEDKTIKRAASIALQNRMCEYSDEEHQEEGLTERQQLINMIWTFPSKTGYETDKILINFIKDEDERAAATAISVLAISRSKHVNEVLIDSIQDPRDRVASAAAYVSQLGAIGKGEKDKAIVENAIENAIIERLKSKNLLTVKSAIKRSKSVPGKSIDKALINLAQNEEDNAIVVASIDALVNRKGKEIHQALVPLIKDSRPEVSIAAINVVRYRLSDDISVALTSVALTDVTKTQNLEVVKTALEAMEYRDICFSALDKEEKLLRVFEAFPIIKDRISEAEKFRIGLSEWRNLRALLKLGHISVTTFREDSNFDNLFSDFDYDDIIDYEAINDPTDANMINLRNEMVKIGLYGKKEKPAMTQEVKDTQLKCMVCNLELKDERNIVFCPHCESPAHEEHLIEWLHVNNICPCCKEPLNERSLSLSESSLGS